MDMIEPQGNVFNDQSDDNLSLDYDYYYITSIKYWWISSADWINFSLPPVALKKCNENKSLCIMHHDEMIVNNRFQS